METRAAAAARVLTLLVLAFAPIPLLAQLPGDLTGRLLDPAGAPVADALVELMDSDGRPISGASPAVTGGDGAFRLPGAGTGLLRIRVTHAAWGMHELPFQLEGIGTARLEIVIAADEIRIESATLGPAARPEDARSGGSRNVVPRERLQEAAAGGLTLGEFLAREVPGMRARPTSGVGGGLCVEFRMTRGDEACRPPQVFLDGAPIMSPLDLFLTFSPGELEQIQMIAPSEAGTRFGNQSGWGVLLLRTTRAEGFMAGPAGGGIPGPVDDLRPRLDWSDEPHPYRWGRVYTAAFLGNAAGLAGGMALMGRCMDLGERRIYRNEDHCGHVVLALSAISMAFLPSLGGSAGAHLAGATGRSTGRMLYSTMAAQALLIPGFALASQVGDDGRSATEVAGLVLITAGAPLVNALVDRLFRDPR
jgi:hypothetical protein